MFVAPSSLVEHSHCVISSVVHSMNSDSAPDGRQPANHLLLLHSAKDDTHDRPTHFLSVGG